MFYVEVIRDYKHFEAGSSGTVLHVHSDINSLPLLLIADEEGRMSWCEAEFFRYTGAPKHAGGRPKKEKTSLDEPVDLEVIKQEE